MVLSIRIKPWLNLPKYVIWPMVFSSEQTGGILQLGPMGQQSAGANL